MGFENPGEKKQFEIKMRSEARANGEESKLYSHDAVHAREAYDAQTEFHAKERNANRNIFHKLLGMKKTTGMDITREEAERVNRLVDEGMLADKGANSTQEAADEIGNSSEFESPKFSGAAEIFEGGKDSTILSSKVEAVKNKIEFKEFLLSEDPESMEALEGGDPTQVIEFIEEVREGMDRESAYFYRSELGNLITDRMNTFAATKNYDALRVLITKAGLAYVPKSTLVSMPDEVLDYPPIAQMLTLMDSPGPVSR